MLKLSLQFKPIEIPSYYPFLQIAVLTTLRDIRMGAFNPYKLSLVDYIVADKLFLFTI
jgi:hypothetical protein